MNTRNDDVSKVTKVLIHKVHGGRKKDSKFWNDKVNIDQKSLDNIPIEPPKKKHKLALFSAISFTGLLISFLIYALYTYTTKQDQITYKTNSQHYTKKAPPLKKSKKSKPG